MAAYAPIGVGGRVSVKSDDVDLESGEMLYPGILRGENHLRWGFVRKVYGILTAQIILTTLISAVTILYAPINDLLRDSSGLMFFLIVSPFILMLPLYCYRQSHPWNLLFLGLFTASLSLTVAVSCANVEGRIILEALILTSAVVSALTGYTFWASKRGMDFNFLGPILFASLTVLCVAGLIQAFFPLGSTASTVYSAIGAIIFSGYIVYDTESLIKRFTYDEYIWASVNLYLDILNLFLHILRMLQQDN